MQVSIKLDTLYDFFKNLNNSEHNENDFMPPNTNNDTFNNEILNEVITQDEILA